MRKLFIPFAIFAVMGLSLMPLALVNTGCKTSSTGTNPVPAIVTTYNTLSTTEQLVTQAYQGFLDSVLLGITPTNSVPTVSAAYNATQMGIRQAALSASGGMAALTPATVAQQASGFTTLVQTVKGK